MLDFFQKREDIHRTYLHIIKNDAPEPWGTFFQDNVTPQMEGLEELHNNIMFYLAIILFAVSWMMISIIINFKNGTQPIKNGYKLSDIYDRKNKKNRINGKYGPSPFTIPKFIIYNIGKFKAYKSFIVNTTLYLLNLTIPLLMYSLLGLLLCLWLGGIALLFGFFIGLLKQDIKKKKLNHVIKDEQLFLYSLFVFIFIDLIILLILNNMYIEVNNMYKILPLLFCIVLSIKNLNIRNYVWFLFKISPVLILFISVLISSEFILSILSQGSIYGKICVISLIISGFYNIHLLIVNINVDKNKNSIINILKTIYKNPNILIFLLITIFVNFVLKYPILSNLPFSADLEYLLLFYTTIFCLWPLTFFINHVLGVFYYKKSFYDYTNIKKNININNLRLLLFFVFFMFSFKYLFIFIFLELAHTSNFTNNLKDVTSKYVKSQSQFKDFNFKNILVNEKLSARPRITLNSSSIIIFVLGISVESSNNNVEFIINKGVCLLNSALEQGTSLLNNTFEQGTNLLKNVLTKASDIEIPKSKEPFDLSKKHPSFVGSSNKQSSSVGAWDKMIKNPRPVFYNCPVLHCHTIPLYAAGLAAKYSCEYLHSILEFVEDSVWNNQYINSTVENFQSDFLVFASSVNSGTSDQTNPDNVSDQTNQDNSISVDFNTLNINDPINVHINTLNIDNPFILAGYNHTNYLLNIERNLINNNSSSFAGRSWALNWNGPTLTVDADNLPMNEVVNLDPERLDSFYDQYTNISPTYLLENSFRLRADFGLTSLFNNVPDFNNSLYIDIDDFNNNWPALMHYITFVRAELTQMSRAFVNLRNGNTNEEIVLYDGTMARIWTIADNNQLTEMLPDYYAQVDRRLTVLQLLEFIMLTQDPTYVDASLFVDGNELDTELAPTYN